MKKYLFPKTGGGFVYGKTKRSTCPSGVFRKEPSDDGQLLTITNVFTGITEDSKNPVTEFYKEDDTAYASLDELEAAVEGFFFNVGGVGSNGFLVLPNKTTGLNVRIGARTGFVYAVDAELIAGGFSGDEGVGWVNVGGVAE